MPHNATQTWQHKRLKLDLTPPMLFITGPTNSTINVPVMQLHGYSPEALATISYDLKNASGLATNQNAGITDQYYSTNNAEYTTNRFEAVDIPLAGGTNIITLHATDLAGNTTTTNITFIFDNSSRTNPPVVQLYWPQNGSRISVSNYTWRGWVDDPTATVMAQMVDTNGNTNILNGLVERNGSFWVENLPLDTGTNYLTLTVTDSAGNVAVTNITVTPGAVSLAIDLPAADQLWNKYINVTGTIDNQSDYTVWVNGVKAALHGDGTWAATNVYLPNGGTTVIQARAIPNSANGGNGTGGSGGGPVSCDNLGNPSGADAADSELQTNNPPAIIETSDFYNFTLSQIDTNANGSSYSQENVLWFPDSPYDIFNSVTWSYPGNVGFQIGDQSCPPLPECYYDGSFPPGTVTAVASTNGVTVTNTGPGDEPWYAESQHCEKTELWNNGTYHFSAQSTFKLRTGGKACVSRQSVFKISCTANQILDLIDTSQQASIPPTNIKIMGKPLDADGNLYVVLSDNDERDITAEVGGADYYVFDPDKQKYTLNHQTACDIPTNTDRTTIGIGEVVNFSGMPDTTIWSVSGGGTVSPTNGPTTTFTASMSPGSSVVTATVDSTSHAVPLTVIAPSGIGNISVYTNIGLGALGSNHIGADTEFNVQVLPTTVNFGNAHLQEDFPVSSDRHWPDGEVTAAAAAIKPLPNGPCASFNADEISDGPFPIGRLYNGTNYVGFSYTRTWQDEYIDANGKPVPFQTLNTTTTFRASDQSCQETYQGVPGGSWQGPWR